MPEPMTSAYPTVHRCLDVGLIKDDGEGRGGAYCLVPGVG
jgi:hypothetical protein